MPPLLLTHNDKYMIERPIMEIKHSFWLFINSTTSSALSSDTSHSSIISESLRKNIWSHYHWNRNVIFDKIFITVYTQIRHFVNSDSPSATYMRQWTGSALVQIMTCRLVGAKPLPEPMLVYCQLNPQVKFKSRYKTFHSWKCIWKHLRNGGHFGQFSSLAALKVVILTSSDATSN